MLQCKPPTARSTHMLKVGGTKDRLGIPRDTRFFRHWVYWVGDLRSSAWFCGGALDRATAPHDLHRFKTGSTSGNTPAGGSCRCSCFGCMLTEQVVQLEIEHVQQKDGALCLTGCRDFDARCGFDTAEL